jgi:hypothetical protein
MKKLRSTLLSFVAGGVLAVMLALPLTAKAGWDSPTTITEGTRVVVSSNSNTLILDYRANAADVLIYSSSTCANDWISLGQGAVTVSTTTSSRLLCGEVIYWGPYAGKLYGQSSPGCVTTVNIFRKK